MGPEGGTAPSYGSDDWTAAASQALQEVFEDAEADVSLITNGTASNSLALASMCPPYGAILCANNAHIVTSECNAVESYTGGARLEGLPVDAQGRICCDKLAQRLEKMKTHAKFPHECEPRVVSITQPTEGGAVYTLSQIQEICKLAHEHGLMVHMDGARFANALATLQERVEEGEGPITPAAMSWQVGVDVLSFGTTKNGTFCAEALIVFASAKHIVRELKFRCKRAGLLLEKQRFLGAQICAYLKDDVWIRAARNANTRAAQLAQGIDQTPGCTLAHMPDVNIVFVSMPRPAVDGLLAKGVQLALISYQPAKPIDSEADHESVEKVLEDATKKNERVAFRMCTQWSTKESDIDEFLQILHKLCQKYEHE
eukprot:CAMPEP_0171522356 /NCGR_PEP_ID=MMETSP0959-20130129/7697_1 /TAXON_ID=87120 /ORGANISM="Aurantiochytrium limacinum, Strain ATCCMYA-1381" /LENGTH=370 /DNA_ID=CAMNT_0012062469 /DNA_START=1583 /DNA_END=2695 /DNA_ORIENTATION=-